MSGEIKHQWNGSVLTVISDSGASSADLKGPKGDTGPRGPQGPAGVIYDENGELVVDLSIFYTTGEIDEKFANYTPDLTNYATKTDLLEAVENVEIAGYATEEYVDEQIVNMATGGSINLDNYYTKNEVEEQFGSYKVNVDEKTIITNGDGTISTAIGGYIADYIIARTGMNAAPQGDGITIPLYDAEELYRKMPMGVEYGVLVVYEGGVSEEFTFTWETEESLVNANNHTIVNRIAETTIEGSTYIRKIQIMANVTEPHTMYLDFIMTDGTDVNALTAQDLYIWNNTVGIYSPIELRVIHLRV